MKSVDILIPNHNSEEVIELCVESIIGRTDYPDYRIIVHDESTTPFDARYLAEAEARGDVKYVRGATRANWEADRMRWSPAGHPAPYWHGCAINELLHKHCRSDYAIILDADVYVINENWLNVMTGLLDDETLVAAHEWSPSKRSPGLFVPGWWRPHFMALNMAAYNDGMKVDWRGGSATALDDPYRLLMARLPEEYRARPDATVLWDPGSSLWLKMLLDNPKGYRGVPLPEGIEDVYYRHFKQKSLRRLQPSEMEELARELVALRMARADN